MGIMRFLDLLRAFQPRSSHLSAPISTLHMFPLGSCRLQLPLQGPSWGGTGWAKVVPWVSEGECPSCQCMPFLVSESWNIIYPMGLSIPTPPPTLHSSIGTTLVPKEKEDRQGEKRKKGNKNKAKAGNSLFWLLPRLVSPGICFVLFVLFNPEPTGYFNIFLI